MQMEQAAAHIGKKTSWQLILGSLFLNLKKEIALFQYKTDYFGANFKKAIVRPDKKLQLMCFVGLCLGFLWRGLLF